MLECCGHQKGEKGEVLGVLEMRRTEQIGANWIIRQPNSVYSTELVAKYADLIVCSQPIRPTDKGNFCRTL